MSDSQDAKKEKIRNFFKNKWNLALIFILIIAFAVRLYYFLISYNQALWWDEAEYLGIALHWVKDVYYDINIQRPPFFPFLIAIFMKLSLSETIIRFFLEFLPSFFTVILAYLIGKEFYDKNFGIGVAFLMAVFWLNLFLSTRVLTDTLLFLFTLLSIYFFWKGYIKKERKFFVYLFGFSLGFALLTKLTAVLTIFLVLSFLLLTEKFKFLKRKELWFAVIAFILVLLPLFIYDKFQFGKSTAFLYGSHVTYNPEGIKEKPIGWHIIGINCTTRPLCNVFKWYGLTVFYAFFFIGLISLYKLILGLDLLYKNKDENKYNYLKADLFIVLWILVNLLYFIFLERDSDDRWLYPIALPVLILILKGILFVYNNIKNYNKQIAIFILAVILLSGSYYQLKQADNIIKSKRDSYIQLKDVSFFIKSNTKSNDVIFSKSVPQMTYYSERGVYGIPSVKDEFIKESRNLKPRYLVLSSFEVHSQTTLNYPNDFPNSLVPVKAYFLDQEKTRPLLVLYEFKNYDF